MGDMVFEGTITRGLGKGAVFLSIGYYKEKIKEKLGFEPFPGTLNLLINKEQTDLLKEIAPIRVESFKKGNKTFGGVHCYKAKINNVEGSIIVPDLTEHDDVIEFIAPVNLKSELNVKNGDKIRIELIE